MALFKSAVRLLNSRIAPCVVTAKRSFAQEGGAVDSSSWINVETDPKGIATVSMQRLPVNSLNLELLSELNKTITQLEKDRCRGLILTSACPSVFSAGLDITEMYQFDKKRLPNFWSTLQAAWLNLYSCSMPSVAVINGHSPAGGCLLAMSCEYRVMVGTKFTIGLNETLLGIVAPKWFLVCMRNIIGDRQTEMALTRGTLFTAEQAHNIGLIDNIADSQERAMEEARNFIDGFKRIPPMARTASKLKVREENIEWMKANQMEDIEAFVDFIKQDEVQKALGLYIQSLKKKA